MATISRLSVSLTANPKGFQKGFKQAELSVTSFQRSVGNVGAAIAGTLTGIGIGLLGRDLVSVNEKFQNLKSSLKTVTGSAEAADAAFQKIETFALNTPFNLDQVVGSFIKLKALGLDPSERALNSYGNTASAMGKSLNQMIEAVADASVGEFERLKEFGIKARSEGDKVSFTFQGITTTVQKNAEAIQGYLLGIGENQFGGAMADQMENLTPAFSNFRASIEKLFLAVGEGGLNDAIVELTTNTTDWINSLDAAKIGEFTKEALGFLGDVVDLYGKISDFIALGVVQGNEVPAGMIPAGPSDYQLGDFNNAQRTFEDWASEVRGQGDEQVAEQKRTNELLENITQSGAIAQ
jgi:hypothetical protein